MKHPDESTARPRDREPPLDPALENPFSNDNDPNAELSVKQLDDIYLIGVSD